MSELKAYIAPTADGTGLADYYLKSEADRYIAHQKYKRCEAMAEYCASELEIAFRDTCIERSVQGCVFFRRWLNIWRDLAEKFKEAK